MAIKRGTQTFHRGLPLLLGFQVPVVLCLDSEFQKRKEKEEKRREIDETMKSFVRLRGAAAGRDCPLKAKVM